MQQLLEKHDRKIAGQETRVESLNNPNVLLERELTELKAQTEEQAVALRRLYNELAGRDRRISELELTLKTAAEETLEKIGVLQKIRITFEEESSRVAQIKALERDAANLTWTLSLRIKELVTILDGIETAAMRLYRSRRWRLANSPPWLLRWFTQGKSRQFRRYWRIDELLVKYREWRARNSNLGNS